MLYLSDYLVRSTLYHFILIKEDEWVVQAEGLEIAIGVLIGLAYMFLVFKGNIKKYSAVVKLVFFSCDFLHC